MNDQPETDKDMVVKQKDSTPFADLAKLNITGGPSDLANTIDDHLYDKDSFEEVLATEAMHLLVSKSKDVQYHVDAILQAHQDSLREARIEENQRRLDMIEAYRNRVPAPGELTASSFGRAGAGMVESAFEQSFKDRITQLNQSKERDNG